MNSFVVSASKNIVVAVQVTACKLFLSITGDSCLLSKKQSTVQRRVQNAVRHFIEFEIILFYSNKVLVLFKVTTGNRLGYFNNGFIVLSHSLRHTVMSKFWFQLRKYEYIWDTVMAIFFFLPYSGEKSLAVYVRMTFMNVFALKWTLTYKCAFLQAW